jgi:hypothetical protein
MLVELLDSAAHQTRPFDQIVVTIDHAHSGAPANLARAFEAVDCDYVVPMGDDDWLAPTHVERCLAFALERRADVVYTGFTVVGGTNPFEYWFGQEFTPELLERGSCIPGGGAFVRSQAIRDCGGMPIPGQPDFGAFDDEWPDATHEDYALWLRMLRNGATFAHLAERLWYWRHHSGNTSGRGDRYVWPPA